MSETDGSERMPPKGRSASRLRRLARMKAKHAESESDDAPSPATLAGLLVLGLLIIADPVLFFVLVLVPVVVSAVLLITVLGLPGSAAVVVGVVLTVAVLIWLAGLGSAIKRQWKKDKAGW